MRWHAAWPPASRTPSASWCRPARPRFADLVHGPVRFDRAHIEDFVVLRSDGHPTYHLSVVVDDIDMAITHVVRGDDHISNTPKQVLLYEAFAAPVPAFAHVPLIMGPDKKRLSKRHGATSVMEYERQGYLPEALVNFLALLGWSPGGDDELLSKDELVARFAARRHQHRQRRVQHREARLVQPPVPRAGSSDDALIATAAAVVRARRPVAATTSTAPRRAWFADVLTLLGRAASGSASSWTAPGRSSRRRPPTTRTAPPGTCRRRGCAAHLEALRGAYAELAGFDEAELERTLRLVADTRGVKAGVLIHATRLAMTGRTVSPGLFEMLRLLGRSDVLARLDRLAASLG